LTKESVVKKRVVKKKAQPDLNILPVSRFHGTLYEVPSCCAGRVLGNVGVNLNPLDDMRWAKTAGADLRRFLCGWEGVQYVMTTVYTYNPEAKAGVDKEWNRLRHELLKAAGFKEISKTPGNHGTPISTWFFEVATQVKKVKARKSKLAADRRPDIDDDYGDNNYDREDYEDYDDDRW
jgi:hypothetical protein